MTFIVSEIPYRAELKNKIYEAFHHAAIAAIGVDGLQEDPFCFEIQQNDAQAGTLVIQLFWGQLHIKYLVVLEDYRGQGIGKTLMNHAFTFGKKRGCTFAFAETMSFQALGFYQKLGFDINFTRTGYAQGTSFHYLQKFL